MAKNTEKTLGTVVVELGYLRPEDLVAGVKRQVEEIVFSLFRWEDGRFVFVEGLKLPDKSIHLQLTAASLIYHWIMNIKNIESLKKVFPPGNAVMIHSPDPLMNLSKDVKLDTAATNIFSLVNGKRHVQEILALCPDDEGNALRTLYALKSIRLLEIVESEKESPEDTLDAEVFQETPKEDTPVLPGRGFVGRGAVLGGVRTRPARRRQGATGTRTSGAVGHRNGSLRTGRSRSCKCDRADSVGQ